jgi:hypothetical protein
MDSSVRIRPFCATSGMTLTQPLGAGHPGEEDIGGLVLVYSLYMLDISIHISNIFSWPELLKSSMFHTLPPEDLQMREVLWQH